MRMRQPPENSLQSKGSHCKGNTCTRFIKCIMFVFLTYAQRAYRLQYNVICATTNFVGMLCMCGVKPRPLRMTAALAGALSASIASNC